MNGRFSMVFPPAFQCQNDGCQAVPRKPRSGRGECKIPDTPPLFPKINVDESRVKLNTKKEWIASCVNTTQ